MSRSITLIGVVLLLLSSCTFRSKAKTERMVAVVSEVRDKYRADEDISNDNQIFEAYDYFVDTKDYQNAAPAALYSGRVRQAKKEYEAAMNYYKEADHYGRMTGDSVSAAFAQYYIGDLLNNSGNEAEAILNYKAAAELWGDSLSRKAKCINAVAMMNIVIDEYDSAFVYLEQALKLAQASNDQITESSVWNNYSVAYQLTDDWIRKSVLSIKMVIRLHIRSFTMKPIHTTQIAITAMNRRCSPGKIISVMPGQSSLNVRKLVSV